MLVFVRAFEFFFSFCWRFSMGSINRKITTIFKFCITKLHYLSSLGAFQALFLWIFCYTWHNSHRNFDCSDVLTYNGYFNSSSMRQLNFLTFIDNLKTFFFFNLASWFKGWGDCIDHSIDLTRFLFHLARTCSITKREVAFFGLPSTLFLTHIGASSVYGPLLT